MKQTKFLVQVLSCAHIKNVGSFMDLKGLAPWIALRVRFGVRKIFFTGHTGPTNI